MCRRAARAPHGRQNGYQPPRGKRRGRLSGDVQAPWQIPSRARQNAVGAPLSADAGNSYHARQERNVFAAARPGRKYRRPSSVKQADRKMAWQIQHFPALAPPGNPYPDHTGYGRRGGAVKCIELLEVSIWMRTDLFIHSESRWLRCPQRVGLTFSVPRNIRNQLKTQGRNAKAALTPTLAPALLSLRSFWLDSSAPSGSRRSIGTRRWWRTRTTN